MNNSIEAGNAYVRLSIKDEGIENGVRLASKKLDGLAEAIRKVGVNGALTLPALMMPVSSSIRAFGEFETKMRMVQAVTRTTASGFRALSVEARRLGAETSYTASEVAEGMISLGRMGFNDAEIKGAIEPMLALARVTGESLGDASRIAANAMQVFNVEFRDASKAADILSVAANSSAQTLFDLGESLKYASPYAVKAGADLEDTAASLAILANMGIRGSVAGTALAKSYKRLSDPKIQAFLKGFQIDVLDANKDLREMRYVLRDLAVVMRDMSSAEKINFAEEVFDARGSLGGGSLVANVEAIDGMLAKLRNSSGEAISAMRKFESGIGGSLKRISSAADETKLAFGQTLSFNFQGIIVGATKGMNVVSDFIKRNKEFTSGLINITGVVALFNTGMIVLKKTASALTNTYSKLAELEKSIISIATIRRTKEAEKRAKELATIEEVTARKAVLLEEEKAKAAEEAQARKEVAIKKTKFREARNANLTAGDEALKAQQEMLKAQQRVTALSAAQAKAEKTRIATWYKFNNESVKLNKQLNAVETQRLAVTTQIETLKKSGADKKEIKNLNGRLSQLRQEKKLIADNIKELNKRRKAEYAPIDKMVQQDNPAEMRKALQAVKQKTNAYNAAAAASKSARAAETLAIAAVDKSTASLNACEAAYKQAHDELLSYTISQNVAARSEQVRLAVLGKLTKAQLLGAAVSSKHAKTIQAASISQLANAMATAKGLQKATLATLAMAAATKSLAAALILLRGAMNWIVQHPLLVAIGAIIGAYLAWKKHVDNVRASVERLSVAQEALANRAKEKVANIEEDYKNAVEKFKYIDEVAKKTNTASKEEMEKAKQAWEQLKEAGLDAGISLKNGRYEKETFVTNESEFSKAAQEKMLGALHAQMSAINRASQVNLEQMAGLDGYEDNKVALLGGLNERAEIDTLGLDISEDLKNVYNRQISLMKDYEEARKKAIQVEESGMEGFNFGEEADKLFEKRKSTEEEIESLRKDLASAEEKNMLAFYTDQQKDLYEIDKERKETMENYKKVLEDMRWKKSPAEEIKAMEARMEKADADYAKRVQKINKEYADKREQSEKEADERIESSYRNFADFLAEMDEENRISRERTKNDDKFKSLMDDEDFSGAKTFIESLIKTNNSLFAGVRKEYTDALASFRLASSEDGAAYSEGEQETLRKLQETLNRLNSNVFDYESKRKDVEDAATQTMEKSTDVFGAWSAKDLNEAMYNAPFEERTAVATEALVRIQERTFRETKKQSELLSSKGIQFS